MFCQLRLYSVVLINRFRAKSNALLLLLPQKKREKMKDEFLPFRWLAASQKQRIVFCGEHQCDGAKCTDTANANDFQRQIHETVPVEQYFEVVCQTVAIASKNLLNVGAVVLQVDKGMMKDEWRSLLDSVSAAIVFSQRGKVMLGNAALPFFFERAY
jgi:hypothetical protein